jgi:hypothetical protein
MCSIHLGESTPILFVEIMANSLFPLDTVCRILPLHILTWLSTPRPPRSMFVTPETLLELKQSSCISLQTQQLRQSHVQ